jgi:ribosome-binding protein aMBF1 (putative translation factor)
MKKKKKPKAHPKGAPPKRPSRRDGVVVDTMLDVDRDLGIVLRRARKDRG